MWQGHFILAMPSLMLWKTVLQDGKEMPYMLAMTSVVSLWIWRLTSLTYKTTSLSVLQLYKPLLGFVDIS